MKYMVTDSEALEFAVSKLEEYKEILLEYKPEIIAMPITNIKNKINSVINALTMAIHYLKQRQFQNAFEHSLAVSELLNVIKIDMQGTPKVMANNPVYQDIKSILATLPDIQEYIEDKI